MRLEWVKQQLVRGGAAAASHAAGRRGSHASTSGKTSAYVIAEAMVPSGCSCVLISPRKHQTKETPSNARHAASALPQQGKAQLSHVRHRVTLPGITPGTILRTRQSVVEWMRAARQLPAPDQYSVLMLDGRRASPKSGTAVSLSPLPYQHGTTQTCVCCPWMATHIRQQSGSAKQKAWRASLLGAVQNCWSASVSDRRRHSGLSRETSAASHSYAQVLDCVSFLEPLSTPVVSNQLQGLQLQFRQPFHQDYQRNSAESTEASALDAGSPHSSASHHRAEIELVREGSATQRASLTAYGLASGGNRNVNSTPSATVRDASLQEHCPLETLEQQRLATFLQRWAAQLPTSMQERLLGVFISQPSATHTAPSTTQARLSNSDARSSLQVVLMVERDSDVLGVQSPLCGPAHPSDFLSNEEQQLVGVVMAAAPLLADITVAVYIVASDEARHARSASLDPCVHVLYPKLNREGSPEQFQLDVNAGAVVGSRQSALSSALSVRCWCEPLARELHARLPPYHAALSAMPFTWLCGSALGREGVSSRTSSSQLRDAARGSRTRGEGGKLPWVPTFWRHPTALDMCCSVVMSMLLEEMSLTSDSSTAAASSAQNDSLNVTFDTASTFLSPSTRLIDVAAFAGQRVLDKALLSLIANSTREDVREVCPTALDSPLRFLLSVSEGTTPSLLAGHVDVALSAASQSRPVRVYLYACTTLMNTEELSALAASVLQRALSAGGKARVRSGVIDVDPLSSAYVAYAQIDLKPRVDACVGENTKVSL